jgi:hypothetical protein
MANKYRLKFTLSNGETIDAGEIVVPEGAPGKDGKDGAAGAKGADGYSPVKGVDYFTDTEKAAIVQDVLAALPYYDGSVTISGGVELIEFAIGLTAYQAEAGMTWEQWVGSSYNTGGFVLTGLTVRNSEGLAVAKGSGSSVTATDTINNGWFYTLVSQSSND